jgi:hypothetical protein
MIETAMKPDPRALAIALGGALLLAGCGKPKPGDQSSSPEPASSGAVSEAPASAATATSPAATNEAISGGGEFAQKSEASPFAQADLALKESFNRALIAFQIGDYTRALSELQDLAANSDLTPRQKQAVQDLLAQTLKAAPELAATNSALAAAVAGKAGAVSQFPVTDPASAENPFSTADPAVRDSFARAKNAHNIGDYEKAQGELKDLSTNAQLNWQQKYAVQSLLDKTPQTAPAAPASQSPNR